MNTRFVHRAARAAAFTVVELMVAISVLGLIIVVLYNVFDNTQRAMRSNAAQVDVMEGARAAIELVGRDLEQMTPVGLAGATNFLVAWWSSNLVQSLPGPTNTLNRRTNFQQQLFFTSQFNKQVSGIGYRVVPATGVGTLYRYVDAEPLALLTPYRLSSNYFQFANTNYVDLNPATYPNPVFQRVVDGVVHFRVTAFDSLGRRIEPYEPQYGLTNRYAGVFATNETLRTWPRYLFVNDAVPAAVEIELGILEPAVLDRYRSMNNPAVAANYLVRQASRVHVFQQRIPVRAAPALISTP